MFDFVNTVFLKSFSSGVLNLFLTADRSTLDNFTADRWCSEINRQAGGWGGGWVGVGGWVVCA